MTTSLSVGTSAGILGHPAGGLLRAEMPGFACAELQDFSLYRSGKIVTNLKVSLSHSISQKSVSDCLVKVGAIAILSSTQCVFLSYPVSLCSRRAARFRPPNFSSGDRNRAHLGEAGLGCAEWWGRNNTRAGVLKRVPVGKACAGGKLPQQRKRGPEWMTR